MFRRVLKSDLVRNLGCRLVSLYIWLVFRTSPWRVVRGEIPKKFWDRGEPFILAFWHGRIAMMVFSWQRSARISMLISRHRDGEMIANVIARYGFSSIRGSAAKPGSDKAKGGQAALKAMLRLLREGESVGITPDGPRGPRMRASDGATALARLSGAPVIPAAFATRRRKVLSSWDRFILPLPFTRGVFVWGEPVHVDRKGDDASLERARQAIEDGLNAVTHEADRLVGQDVIEPAPRLAVTDTAPSQA
jgi:lysophospholipid acyltransferase (LPLAT)-like uncharacterized protein